MTVQKGAVVERRQLFGELLGYVGWSACCLQWRPACGEGDTPFWWITVPNDEAARDLAERSVLVKAIIEVWGEGQDDAEVVTKASKYDAEARVCQRNLCASLRLGCFLANSRLLQRHILCNARHPPT